jgi:hypothetical protein
MGLFDKLLRPKQQTSSQEAVLIHFELGFKPNGDLFQFDDMVDLEDKLIAAIEPHNVGESDGHEIGQADGTIFAYGPDADHLFKAMEPVLQVHPLCRGGRAVLRKGGPGSPQTEVQL